MTETTIPPLAADFEVGEAIRERARNCVRTSAGTRQRPTAPTPVLGFGTLLPNIDGGAQRFARGAAPGTVHRIDGLAERVAGGAGCTS